MTPGLLLFYPEYLVMYTPIGISPSKGILICVLRMSYSQGILVFWVQELLVENMAKRTTPHFWSKTVLRGPLRLIRTLGETLCVCDRRWRALTKRRFLTRWEWDCVVWSEEETSHLVNVVKDMNIMSFVDGRKYRDSDICKKVSEKLSCCCRCYWLQEEESEMTRIASWRSPCVAVLIGISQLPCIQE